MIALFLLALQVTTPSGAPLKSRVDLLATWIQAADAHMPNTVDAPLQVVRALSRAEIATVMEDLRSLVILLREPKTETFDVQEGTSRTSHRIPYTSRDVEMLRDLARPIRESRDFDRPLKRGAMLHGDIARLAPPEGEPYDISVPVGPFAQTALLTDDGRRTRRVKMVSHWSAAMAILDEVRPKSALRRTPRAPAESPFVKRWYRAILAWQVREQEFVAPIPSRRRSVSRRSGHSVSDWLSSRGRSFAGRSSCARIEPVHVSVCRRRLHARRTGGRGRGVSYGPGLAS